MRVAKQPHATRRSSNESQNNTRCDSLRVERNSFVHLFVVQVHVVVARIIITISHCANRRNPPSGRVRSFVLRVRAGKLVIKLHNTVADNLCESQGRSDVTFKQRVRCVSRETSRKFTISDCVRCTMIAPAELYHELHQWALGFHFSRSVMCKPKFLVLGGCHVDSTNLKWQQ